MKRYMLRKKETKVIIKQLKETTGIEIKGEMERVEFNDEVVILVDGEPIILEYEEKYYFTVYGLLKFRPERGKIVVDKGAMPHIINGADVMKPGIIYADESIKKGEFVYVVVEEKETPLAVGIALVDGKEMKNGKGKAVKNIHHLKDKIWKYFFK
ncbi:MAG TPA: DUF1947 domain-containing protein [Archaeoglobus profundus]|nr:DUF1947 domain-containing protein [Archaeoglobus profundus]